jgi:hypothetical protein
MDGSPRKMGDSVVPSGGVDDGSGSDRRSPTVKVGYKEVVQKSSRNWLGRRWSEGHWRWWGEWRKTVAKTTALAGGVAVGSGSQSASTVEDVEAKVSADLDGNGIRRWWPVTVSRGISGKRQGGSRSGE